MGDLSKRNKGKKIKRDTADRIFAEAIQRIEQMNSNCDFAYFVDDVRLFGSYLGQAEMVGDIDLAFEFVASDGRILTEIDSLEPDVKKEMSAITRHIRAGSRWIDLAITETIVRHGFPNRVVYTRQRRRRRT